MPTAITTQAKSTALIYAYILNYLSPRRKESKEQAIELYGRSKLSEHVSRLRHILELRAMNSTRSEGEVQDKLEAFEIWLHDHIDKMCSGFKTTDERQKRGMYDY